MPPTPPPVKDDRGFEKMFIVLLFIITVTQFSAFGYQSVRYLLGSVFGISTVSTPIDVIVGFSAMIASALVFAGGAMWWKEMTSAFKFMSIGSMIFVFKNVLDIINEVLLFQLKVGVINNESQIDDLAKILGGQFFQLAFWVFVFFYFRHIIRKQSSVQRIS